VLPISTIPRFYVETFYASKAGLCTHIYTMRSSYDKFLDQLAASSQAPTNIGVAQYPAATPTPRGSAPPANRTGLPCASYSTVNP